MTSTGSCSLWFFILGAALGLAGCAGGAASNPGASSQWVAFSLEDRWRVEVDARGMRLATDDSEDGRQLPVISEQLPDGVMGFRGEHDQGVELWLYPGGCQERTSGNDYPLSAVLIRDGIQLKGCGYHGQTETRQGQ